MEEDDAGRLKAFRNKFGRGWDAETVGVDEKVREGEEAVDGEGEEEEAEESLLDLISGFGQEAESAGTAKGVREGKERSGKGKGGER